MAIITALLDTSIKTMPLKILVFGPQVVSLSSDVRMRRLQEKRIEIRQELESTGYTVNYAEDLVDPSLTGATANAVIQELVIMADYDYIVTLVDSPGSIVEATLISLKPALAQKAALYLDKAYVNGLAGETCRLAEKFGAHFKTYNYPEDLTDCHLLGFIRDRAETIQLMKYLS